MVKIQITTVIGNAIDLPYSRNNLNTVLLKYCYWGSML